MIELVGNETFWTALSIALIVIYFLKDWLIDFLKVDSYNKKHVFIIGCDSGIRRALAIRLDGMGFPVIAGCLTEQRAQSLAKSCSRRLKTVIIDVTNDNSIQAAFDAVKRSLPNDKALWAVVNNAGIVGLLLSDDMGRKEDYIATCHVNLFGPIEVSRVFMPLLKKSQGRLVNITNNMILCPYYAPYLVSKSGLEAFCDIMSREVSRFGVKVSIIDHFSVPSCEEEVWRAKLVGDWDLFNIKAEDVDSVCSVVSDVLESLSPDTHKVVDAYVAAITSRYPRTRYTVGYGAKYLPEWAKKLAMKFQWKKSKQFRETLDFLTGSKN